MSFLKRTNESEVETMDNEPNAERKARRHAVLMRGVVTPILGLLAVAAIGLGIMNATEWKPSRTITAQTQISGSRYVVTDPGVAGLVDSDVTVKVLSGGSGKVCVAETSAKDAAGWLSGERYVRLTGLDTWETLGTEKAGSAGSASDKSANAAQGDADGVDFKDSDMWHSVTCDTKSVEAESDVKDDSTVLLIDLGEKQDADVSFTWTRKTLPDFATPFYFVGGLLAVGAVLTASVFAMPPHRRRKRVGTGTAGQLEERAQQSEEHAEEVTIREALAGSVSSLIAAFKPSKRGGRRHAASSSASGESFEQPTVIDPSARNLVADASDGAQYDDESVGEETSVISPDELQAYFARLARESGESFGVETTGDGEAADSADAGADAGAGDEPVSESADGSDGPAESAESEEPAGSDETAEVGDAGDSADSADSGESDGTDETDESDETVSEADNAESDDTADGEQSDTIADADETDDDPEADGESGTSDEPDSDESDESESDADESETETEPESETEAESDGESEDADESTQPEQSDEQPSEQSDDETEDGTGEDDTAAEESAEEES